MRMRFFQTSAGDPDKFGFAAVLGVALALGIPVHALHGIGDAVLGVNALLVGLAHKGVHCVVRRTKGLAPGLDLPGLQLPKP